MEEEEEEDKSTLRGGGLAVAPYELGIGTAVQHLPPATHPIGARYGEATRGMPTLRSVLCGAWDRRVLIGIGP